MRIIGYARVSTAEQAINSRALEQQIARLKLAGATEIFVDVESGTSDKRTNFKKLIQLVKANAAEEIIITRLDRLTRKLTTLLEIRTIFLNSLVNLRALDNNIDLSTPAGKFHFSLLGSLAEMEVDGLSERIKHGWQAMRNNQRVAVAPFGYVILNQKLIINRAEALCLLKNSKIFTFAELAEEIVGIFLQTKSLRACIRDYNNKFGLINLATKQGKANLSFSHTGLANWLVNPTLCGHTWYPLKRQQEKEIIIYYNTHEALIKENVQQEIKQIIGRNKAARGYGTNKEKHAISGLVYCAHCSKRCYSISGRRGQQGGHNFYFQCGGWSARKCNQKKTTKLDIITEAVTSALISRAEEISVQAAQIATQENKKTNK